MNEDIAARAIRAIKEYFSRRDPRRLKIRALLATAAGALATPGGQAALAAALGKYAWVVPIIVLVIGMLTNGKEPTDAPAPVPPA